MTRPLLRAVKRIDDLTAVEIRWCAVGCCFWFFYWLAWLVWT